MSEKKPIGRPPKDEKDKLNTRIGVCMNLERKAKFYEKFPGHGEGNRIINKIINLLIADEDFSNIAKNLVQENTELRKKIEDYEIKIKNFNEQIIGL